MHFEVPSMRELPYVDGQHPPNVVGPWARQAEDIRHDHHTTGERGYFVPLVGRDHVRDMRDDWGAEVASLHSDVSRARTVNLGRTSGALNRVMSVSSRPQLSGSMPFINPAAYGSTNGGLGALQVNPSPIGTYGFRGTSAEEPWYQNPWYLGAGAAALGVGAWFLLRKKRR